MSASGNQDRGRLTQATRSWRLVVISTGERRLWTASGLTGLRSRVVEIQAPITDSAQTSDDVLSLVESAYGWPLKWLVEQAPELTPFDLRATVASRVAKRFSTAVALCAAGFDLLGRMVGLDVSEQAEAAALAVLTELADTLNEEGDTVAERLYQAVLGDVARNGDLYPNRNDSLHFAGRDLHGFMRDDEHVCVFPTVLKDIARDAGLDDFDAAVRDLAKRGLVLRRSERAILRQETFKGERPSVYTFRRFDPTEIPEEAQAWLESLPKGA